MALIIIGVILIFYFLGIIIFTGLGSKFPLVWFVSGLLLSLSGVLSVNGKLKPQCFPQWLKTTLIIFLLLGLTFFGLVQGLILSGFRGHTDENMDYIVVLGAQMKENGPSGILKKRLDKAYKYLNENVDTIVVVTGGKGSNEPMAEAVGMKQYLVDRGIPENRIITEQKSVNTHQNIIFARELIEKDLAKKEEKINFADVHIGIVTSNFHSFRSGRLARKAGYQRVYAIAASSDAYLLPNNMVREFFGIIKDALVGNL